uniref:Uncharacterized protein n=1 Tax=viral metagenome TaxID=1070528 RepID=A0A6M3J9F9_9ZZZZ
MKFPKKIYVKIEKDDDEDEFLILGQNPSDIADHEDVTKAAVYVLEQEVTLVNLTEVHPRT